MDTVITDSYRILSAHDAKVMRTLIDNMEEVEGLPEQVYDMLHEVWLILASSNVSATELPLKLLSIIRARESDWTTNDNGDEYEILTDEFCLSIQDAATLLVAFRDNTKTII